MPTSPEYPPYVNGYGGIPKLFAKIKQAAVPPKFTQDYLNTILDLKSSSFRAMIPLLKRLGFIDQANVPTPEYKDYREESLSGRIMAERMREAYKVLFAANEYAYKLDKKELQARLKSLLGVAEDDQNIPNIAGTFLELAKLATWDTVSTSDEKPIKASEPDPSRQAEGRGLGIGDRLGLSYTINLNLPATTEIEVFNAIFKSLRENLLREL